MNPFRFGLKTLLVGLAVGLTMGLLFAASAVFPPLAVILPGIFVFMIVPKFAFAGAYAGPVALAAVGAFTFVAGAAVLETLDRVFSAVWGFGNHLVGNYLNSPSKKTDTAVEAGNSSAPASLDHSSKSMLTAMPPQSANMQPTSSTDHSTLSANESFESSPKQVKSNNPVGTTDGSNADEVLLEDRSSHNLM